MEVKGKIIVLNDTKEYGSNGFKKRELVVETFEDYPQKLQIEFVQDKCDVLNSYQNGDNVIIGVNLRGREWENPEGKIMYFNSIQGWKISKDDSVVLTPPSHPVLDANLSNDDGGGDLPF